MPTDLRRLDLTDAHPAARPTPARLILRPITPEDAEELARLYLDAYPPEVGAADLDDASREIAATFAGEFGRLRVDLSLIARLEGAAVGAVLVTTRSIWDAELEGPFVIDFLVAPQVRGRGVGRGLLAAAIDAAVEAGDRSLALRVGAGTAPAAHRLYERFGFVDPGACASSPSV